MVLFISFEMLFPFDHFLNPYSSIGTLAKDQVGQEDFSDILHFTHSICISVPLCHEHFKGKTHALFILSFPLSRQVC